MRDNLRNEKNKFVGKMKEKVGDAVDDNELELKGKLQSIKGNIGSSAEDMKEDVMEAANNLIDKVKDKKKDCD